MPRPHLYCSELTPGTSVLDESESKHALHSLRMRPGDEAILFDGNGRTASATLLPAETREKRNTRDIRARKRRALFDVEHVRLEPAPTCTLTLIVAGCKGERLRWMVEKLTELGTTRMVFAEFKRSVVRVSATHAAKLRRTALEAAKQCRRVWLPQITSGVTLAEAIADLKQNTLLVAHLDEQAASLSERAGPIPRRLSAVIGPEGGLTEAEIALLMEAGGEIVRLAPTILRVETAAISIAANWAARCGQ